MSCNLSRHISFIRQIAQKFLELKLLKCIFSLLWQLSVEENHWEFKWGICLKYYFYCYLLLDRCPFKAFNESRLENSRRAGIKVNEIVFLALIDETEKLRKATSIPSSVKLFLFFVLILIFSASFLITNSNNYIVRDPLSLK